MKYIIGLHPTKDDIILYPLHERNLKVIGESQVLDRLLNNDPLIIEADNDSDAQEIAKQRMDEILNIDVSLRRLRNAFGRPRHGYQEWLEKKLVVMCDKYGWEEVER